MPSASPSSHSDKNPPGIGNASFLFVENVGSYKWAWVKAAKKANKPLAEWVIDTLNTASTGDGVALPPSAPKTGH